MLRTPYSRLLSLSSLIALVVTARADVLISEIMYHPQSENPLQEYIELHNPDAAAVSVAGWQFTSGVSFTIPAGTTIPAGGYLVVASNAAAFAAKYPTVTNYVAGWVGQLSNNTNNIELKDATLVVRDSVHYADDGDWATRQKDAVADLGYRGWSWYSAADGFGKSLELINKAFDNSKGQNWGDSTTAEGTPGVANSIAATNIAPVISSVEHFPLLPTSSDVVTVNAKLTDELTTGLTATLFWKLDAAGSFTSEAMFDDGAHGDGLAGDGRFGAQIPAQVNGAIVEFYVQASDAAANTRTWPKIAQDYNTGTSTYFASQAVNCLYQVDNTTFAGAMPIYRMVMKAADKVTLAAINDAGGGGGGSHAKFNMTWITVDGSSRELRYTCSARNRGHGSGSHDPQSFHASFTSDQDWKGVTGLNLNTFYTYLQLFGSSLMRKAELACFESRQVQVRINATDLTQAGGLSADGGHSYYCYVANENPDSDYAAHHFPLDSSGNIYSVRREDAGSLEGDLKYIDANPNSYRTVYFKDTNVSEDNWSDLIGLNLALSKGVSTTLTNVSYTPSAAAYAADILTKVDVDQWMRWMAAENLTGNNETNLVGGYGDDYYLYFGKTDIRARLLPHDLDTILGHGDQNSADSPATFASTDSIFQMMSYHGAGATPTALNALIRHQDFAPLFYQAHLDLMGGLLSQANFDSLADQILTGVVSAPTIANRKAWYAARLAYVAAQIPTTISGIVAATTGGTTLTVTSGYSRSTAANCKLSGRSHAGRTRSVKVNGTLAAWDAFNATWTVTPLALTPGINRIKIEALDSTGAEFEEVITDVWYDDTTVASVSGTLGAGTTTWTAAGGPYQVTANLIVPATGTLVIQPGTSVYLNSTITISVTAGGKILAEGTEAQPIRFTRAPGLTTNGGTITINGSAGAPETHFYYTFFEFGGNPAVTATANSNIVMDHCEFGTTTSAYVHLDGGSYLISHCIFPSPTVGTFEPLHGTIGFPAGGRGIVRDSFLGKAMGYNDVFDYTGGNRPGAILQFINNVCTGSDDDILDIDGTDMWTEGNIFMHTHRNGSPDSSSAISGGNDGGGGTGSRKQATSIDTATEQITCGTHGFTTGQEVVGTSWVGQNFPAATPALRNGTYFVRVITTTAVKLYLTAADANADTNAINFSATVGTVTNNVPTNPSIALTTVNGVSNITVVGNLFYDVDQATTAKEGNFYTFLNNTVVSQNNTGSGDAVTGVFNFGDDGYNEAAGMYIEGNIIHSAASLTRNYPGAGLTQNVTFNNNILPPGLVWTGTGSGNTNVDPLLASVRNTANTAFSIPTPGPRDFDRLAVQIRQQFGLKAASPAKGTGPNGTDKGGVRTLGVSLSGAPVGTTNLQTASIIVGTRMTGNGISTFTGAWPGGGSGWTHYKYRLDGGAWSAETVNSAPLSLTGLANGSHTLDVVGKNDAGFYQDDAAFGTSARTASATWTVNTAYVPPVAAPVVRINEVLASNTETLTVGAVFPDLIELTNVGNATADLSGWGITDNAALPYKYTIANGTTLAPGAYLTIYASAVAAVPTPKTGFSVKQSGDDLTLTKSAAQGGTIADSVTWGPQLNDYSIARALDGSWTIGVPTFGAANKIAPTGDIHGVRINEWLADAATLFANDFVELYNPSTLPVDIGGCYLTDNPAEYPNKSLIQPLTFISNSGYISFKADGDTAQGPDHVDFKLSPLQGEIGFMSPAQAAIDVVIYGPQTTDISQGRAPNGSLTSAFFPQPTPGAPNPTTASSTTTNTAVVMGPLQTWKYWANATTGPAVDGASLPYTAAAYDDATWTAAAGQILHYEIDALAWGFGFTKTTTLPTYGSTAFKPYQTYYFRTHFNYTGPLTGVVFNARVACDDGCVITLNGVELPRIRVAAGAVTYALQASNVTDGTVDSFTIPAANIVNGDNVLAVSVHQSSTQSATAGSSDIVWGMQLDAVTTVTTTGNAIVINEILPINATYTNPDSSLHGWIELYNSSGSAVNLLDYSLTNEVGIPRKFVFPSATIAAGGYYVIQCNGLAAASATNTGFSFNGAGDQLFVFNAVANGGGLMDSVVFGQQLPDRSVARIPDASGPFALAVPTRALINSAAATTAITSVKLNEWLTTSVPTWLELYNTAATPVLLSGNYLTDSFGNKTKHLIPPLTYLGGSGTARWLQLIADNDSGATPNHVNFTIENGEGLWLFTNTGTQLDGVAVTAQTGGASQGRLADGSATIVALLPTPGALNQSATTDTDGDGIPDLWELANGLNPNSAADATLDPDGDGQNNKAEYLAGTNPFLPGSKLAASVAKTATPGQYAITFTAIAGKAYTVRYKDDLNAATWTNLQQISAPGVDTVTTVNDTPGVSKRFYQVVTPQQ